MKAIFFKKLLFLVLSLSLVGGMIFLMSKNLPQIKGVTTSLLPEKFCDDPQSPNQINCHSFIGNVLAQTSSPYQNIDSDVLISGKIGMGTSSPVARLDIRENGSQNGLFISNTFPKYAARFDGNVTINMDPVESGLRLDVYGPVRSSGYRAGAIAIGNYYGGGQGVIRSVDATPITFQTYSTTKNIFTITDPNQLPSANSSSVQIAGVNGNTDNRNFKVTYPDGGGLAGTEFSALTHLQNEPGVNLDWTAMYANAGAASYAGVFKGNVKIFGTLTATTKNFEIEYPLDPDKQLVHSSLEGPEVAVFYRGEGQLKDGQISVTLPSYFEALTRAEGRTVLLTPQFKGNEPISNLAASKVENGQFQVKALDNQNPSQKFYWEVKAVRADVPPLQVEKTKSAH
jgi:hypothetical protein